MDRKGAVDQPPASIVIPSSAFQGGPFPAETASTTSPPLKAVQEESDIPPPVKAVQKENDLPPPVNAARDQRASQPADVGAPQGLLLRAGLLALFSAPFGFLTYGFFPDVDASVLTTSLLVLIGVGTLFVYIGVTSGPPRPKRQPSTVVVPTKSTPPSIYDTEVMKANATAPLEEGGDEEEPARSRQHASSDKSTRTEFLILYMLFLVCVGLIFFEPIAVMILMAAYYGDDAFCLYIVCVAGLLFIPLMFLPTKTPKVRVDVDETR